MAGSGSSSHRLLGGSACERWWNCPGSVWAAQGFPRSVSKYAAEGSAAHQLLSDTLMGKPTHYTTLDYDGFSIEITDEMIAAVDVALAYIRALPCPPYAKSVLSELELDMSAIDPDMGGTADVVAVGESVLEVIDYKHGRGTFVAIEGNYQLRFYAMGVVLELQRRGVRIPLNVKLTIIQPRNGKQPIRSETINLMDLYDWELDLREAARRVREQRDLRVPGDWCTWCPALATCREAREHAHGITISPYKQADGSPDLKSLGEALKASGYLRDWLDAVWWYAEMLALTGTKIPRHKLVLGRNSRKWSQGEAVMVNVLKSMGIEPWESTLLSPAKAEKAAGKKREKLALYIETVPGKPTLVEEEDPRPEAHVFGLVENLDEL